MEENAYNPITTKGFIVKMQTLKNITYFDPHINFLNFTADVVGKTLKASTSLPVSSKSINIDLSVRKCYTDFTTAQNVWHQVDSAAMEVSSLTSLQDSPILVLHLHQQL
jgi:hypothetical protein